MQALESETPAGVDAPHLHRIRVDGRARLVGQHPVRGAVTRSGRFLSESFVRTVVVEDVTEAVKDALLLDQRSAWRIGGLLLEGLVHALMTAILLRLTGLDALGNDAEFDPTHRQLREDR